MNVATYARASSLAQDVELSTSAQINALRRHALDNDMIIVEEYIEEAESGRSADRPKFLKMISDAKRGPRPFEGILVWKLSRFARNREDSIVFKAMLKKQGIKVISINEPIDESPSGQLLAGIIETVDEFYSLNLAQDVVRGMREAASRGFWVNSRAPYGYRRKKVVDGAKERSTLMIEAGSSEIVEEIFRLALNGTGVKDIAVSLNSKGVPSPRGKKWGRGRVHKILVNPAYTGTLVFGERGRHHREAGLEPIRVEDAFPAIIDRSTFDRVQASLKDRAPKTLNARRAGSRFLLSGILTCGDCGALLIGHAAKSGKYSYYVCGTAYRLGSRKESDRTKGYGKDPACRPN
jgi:DNA invertase Pin-like site-specific DNA recombinase